MQTQSNVLAAFNPEAKGNHMLAIKVGKNDRNVTMEEAMVRGGKVMQAMMQDAAFALAVHKVQHGNYLAAAGIIGLGANVSIMKVCAPKEGGTWTKAKLLMLAELVLERESTSAKGFTQAVLKGRKMAQLVMDLIGDKAPTDGDVIDPLSNPQ